MASLFVRGRGHVFYRGADAKLRALLEEVDRHTLVVEPHRWQDLALSAAGEARDGGHYTQHGLRQVCGHLAPGLFRLILELSGSQRHPDEPVEDYSLSEAITVFNSLLRRRFDSRLAGKVRLVRDARRRTIDGVVGSKFRLLPNLTFYDRAVAALGGSARTPVLLEAGLAGRRLSLRYADRKALCRAPDGAAWHGGVWLCNSEIGSETPVCGADLLCAPDLHLFALGDLVQAGRVIHAGKDFEDRLKVLFARVLAAACPAGRVKDRFQALGELEYKLPEERDERRDLFARLSKKLARRDLPLAVAKRAVLGAFLGADFDPERPFLPEQDGLSDANQYDLFKALILMAQSQHPSLRERIERVAFTLLQLRTNKK